VASETRVDSKGGEGVEREQKLDVIVL
jgi:hypothetical protein